MGEAVIRRQGEGERHAAGSSAIILKATGDDTAGSLFLAETTIEPGFPGPPPHRHEHLYDMFYVLDGVLTIRLGDERHEIAPGTFVAYRPAWRTPSATRAKLRFGS
ncbi:MAG: cupin domain-containing protein [Solirubrobacterales bacterium]|nr:cupin domain-containing protein [Solirubrobacterales bacterium]MBV9533993.1 cupin domain-containing protein [Solirubrobacterales bacterium]